MSSRLGTPVKKLSLGSTIFLVSSGGAKRLTPTVGRLVATALTSFGFAILIAAELRFRKSLE